MSIYINCSVLTCQVQILSCSVWAIAVELGTKHAFYVIVFMANVNSVFRYLSSPHHFLLSVGFHCRFGQNVENKSQNITPIS